MARLNADVGSSPLTRGALDAVNRLFGWGGLIPAHAGSTRRRARTWFVARAHPRSRGEHWKTMQRYVMEPGSSPLTRGARVLAFDELAVLGLIPAHAGST